MPRSFLRKTKPTKKRSGRLTAEQKTLIRVFRFIRSHPLLTKTSYHVANEGKRTERQGYLLKLQGVLKGVPDIIIDYPTKKHHGLRIELKEISPTTGKYGRPTAEQKEMINHLNELGYFASFSYGYEDTIRIIDHYLKD